MTQLGGTRRKTPDYYAMNFCYITLEAVRKADVALDNVGAFCWPAESRPVEGAQARLRRYGVRYSLDNL
jgi:hypothetical protein